MNFPDHITLYLEHNVHKRYGLDVAGWMLEYGMKEQDWISPEEYKKSIEKQEVWVIQWHTEGEEDFTYYSASTMEALLATAEQEFATIH